MATAATPGGRRSIGRGPGTEGHRPGDTRTEGDRLAADPEAHADPRV
ncbi:hypothetical protein [Streptomyces sp. NPDC026673]